uniref:Genome polyprotein n=1 Tax=Gerbovich virus TaxID=2707221 RepID=A0A6H0DIM5_9VIRU|nr:MAG: polyprotein [Gerbovich virus]
MPPDVNWQMEETNVDPVTSPKLEQSSNVITVDQGAINDVDVQCRMNYLTLMDEGSQKDIMSEMIERYTPFDQFSWTESDGNGKLLKSYNLPNQLFVNKSLNSPNFVALQKFLYWHFDMEFRVQINATRYQIGQLIVAWNYDFNDKTLTSVGEAIQAPHYVLLAPGNNVINFSIPFKYLYPYYKATQIANNIVKLAFFVNSALQVPPETTAKCNVFIMARFTNQKLAGMRSVTGVRFIAEHQMLRSLIKGVEGSLRYLLPDNNRDNPTDVSPASVMVPNSAHSWCVGDNVPEVTNVLRLDALATTPHFDTCEEMKVQNVVRHFGGLGIRKWSVENNFQFRLFTLPVTPIHVSQVRSSTAETSQTLPSYVLTPLARVASLFAYWRGTIEFRFDFVASMFHTGRIAVCFVPGGSTKTFYGDTQSYVQYFDLQDNTSFTYKCPFISDVPWIATSFNSVRFPATNGPSIGDLVAYVVNPLVAIAGIGTTVQIIPYVRGGEDLEFAVPIFPSSFPASLGLEFHASPRSVSVKSGYYPCYSGSWHTTGNALIIRYGAVSDHVAQFTGGVFKQVYYSYWPALIFVNEKNGVVQKSVHYFARASVEGHASYVYMLPFATFEDAWVYADSQNLDHATPFVKDSPFFWQGNTVLEPVSSSRVSEREIFCHQGESDAVESKLDVEPGPSTLVSSRVFFNEVFSDLKTLLRRYSLYCDISIKVPKDIAYGGVFYVVPIIPSGIFLNYGSIPTQNKSMEFQSRTRGGVIANIADGFRFFRGGMRFKIVFRNLNGKDIFLQVTHVPDRYIGNLPKSVKPTSTLDFVGNGYAYYSQSSRVNECIEIETPYYLNSDFGLLCNPSTVAPSIQRNCTLGYLAFSTLSRLEEDYDLTIQLFSSFADDMRFSSFQGFRSAASTFSLPDQLSTSPSSELSLDDEVGTVCIVRERLNSDGDYEIVHQMEYVRDTFRSAGSLFGEGLQHPGRQIGEMWSRQLSNTVNDISESLSDKVVEVIGIVKTMLGDFFSSAKTFLVNVVSQLVHMIYNPCLPTLTIAMATIWASFVPAESCSNLFQTVLGYLRSPRIQAALACLVGGAMAVGSYCRMGPVVHQFDSDVFIGFTASVVTGIATAFGFRLNARRMKECPNFMEYLFTHIREITLTSAGVIAFLRLNVKVFSSIIDWVFQRLAGVGLDSLCLTNSQAIKTWVRASQQILNPIHKQYVFMESSLQRRVFILVAQGQRMMLMDSITGEGSVVVSYIRSLLEKLVKLQEELIDNCYCPNARYCPFVIQIVGPPGIGKSELYCELGISMLEEIDYICCGDPVFVKTSGPAYWNGVRNQPVLLYDDFMFMRAGADYEAQILEFTQLKSCAIFNPSIAELENKKLKYNPLIIALASNAAYWNDSVTIREPEALHRRRDFLYAVRLREGYTMSEVERGFLQRGYKTYDHLEFAQYRNRLVDEGHGPWVSYSAFKDHLMATWKNYHRKELMMYKERLSALDRLKGSSCPIELEPIEDILIDQSLFEAEEKLSDADKGNFSRIVRERVDVSRMTVLGKPRDLIKVDQIVGGEHPSLTEIGLKRTPLNEDLTWEIRQKLRFDRVKKENDLYEKWGEESFNLLRGGPEVVEELTKEEKIALLKKQNAEMAATHQMMSDDEESLISASESLPQISDRHFWLRFDSERYQCPHDQYWSPSWDVVDDEVHGRVWRSITSKKMLTLECDRNCYFYSPEFELIGKDWFVRRYKYVIEKGIWPNESSLPPFARKYLPESERVNNVIDDNLDDAIEQGASRASRALTALGKIEWFKWFKSILKWTGVIATAFLAIFGAYKGMSTLLGSSEAGEPTQEPSTTTQDPWHIHQYGASGDSRTGRNQAKFRSKLADQTIRLKKRLVNHQFDERTPLVNLEALIMRNAFQVSLEVDGVRRFRQKGLGVCGRLAISTKHFLEEFESQSQSGRQVLLYFETENLSISFRREELKFYLDESSSLAIIEFSPRLNSFRDIRKHIISETELGHLGRHGKFYSLDQGKHLFTTVVFDEYEDLEIKGTETVSSQLLPAVYRYQISGPGKCGSVLYTNSAIPKIIGIHVAGVDGGRFGFAQPITSELFADLNLISSTDPPNAHQFEEIPPVIPVPAGVQIIGTVVREEAVSIPTKTQIVRSLMFDAIAPHQTAPAVLRAGDPRCIVNPDVDPVVKAIQTHGLHPLGFEPELLERCVSDLSDTLISTTPRNFALLADVLTDQEVFGGIPASNIKKINLNASEGYPLSQIRIHQRSGFSYFQKQKALKSQPMKGKNWLFDFEETPAGLQLREMHPILRDLININHAKRLRGELPETIFVDVLKDCRVTFDKIEKGKTRMFSMSPIEYTWACKRYFAVFQSAYQESRIVNGTAIGINVHSAEWSDLARSLLEKGSNFIVGDYKSFGDTLSRDVMHGAFQVIFDWFDHNYESSVNNAYRRVLMEEMFNVPHLVYNLMYRMVCGIPSGFALTVEINDLVNQLYIRYCWLKITGRPLSDFHRYCKLVTYGDDLIISVNDVVSQEFNFIKIKDCLGELNIQFQPADKESASYEFLNFFDVTFLKCNFVKHHKRLNFFLAKLPLSSCLDMLNWQYRDNDKVSIIFENCRAALMNLYGHGPKVYHHWRLRMITWIGEAVDSGILPVGCLPCHFKSWVEVDNDIFADAC